MTQEVFSHEAVLKSEVVYHLVELNKSLLLKENSNQPYPYEINVLDCTLGGAGHSEALIEQIAKYSENNKVDINFIACDRDLAAISFSEKKLDILIRKWHHKNPNLNICKHILHAPFSEVIKNIEKLNISHLHIVLADLGVSSPQLDNVDRGFSFNSPYPLDMRMDKNQNLTAFDLLMNLKEIELYNIFFYYGEEPKSKHLAKKIVEERKVRPSTFASCDNFSKFICRTLNYKNSRTHPATRIFQALRIEVNKEIEEINALLEALPALMAKRSRIGIISFHSIEDRLVKHTFRNWSKGKASNIKESKYDFDVPIPVAPGTILEWGKESPKGGIKATEHEMSKNIRSRSARLRVFEFNENEIKWQTRILS